MGRVTERRRVLRIRDGAPSTRPDTLVWAGRAEEVANAVRTTARWPIADTPPVRVTAELLAALPDRLRAAQRVFDRTGGLYAAGLFSPEGELLDARTEAEGAVARSAWRRWGARSAYGWFSASWRDITR
ncbi:hypothetical protein SUDANB51_07378 [Streptomyces sp. enrichment culture]